MAHTPKRGTTLGDGIHAISVEIMRGGAEKAKEAGVVLAGGHTIQDPEPKYGLICVAAGCPPPPAKLRQC